MRIARRLPTILASVGIVVASGIAAWLWTPWLLLVAPLGVVLWVAWLVMNMPPPQQGPSRKGWGP